MRNNNEMKPVAVKSLYSFVHDGGREGLVVCIMMMLFIAPSRHTTKEEEEAEDDDDGF